LPNVKLSTETVYYALEPVLTFSTSSPFLLQGYKLEATANGGMKNQITLNMFTCNSSNVVVSEPTSYPSSPFNRDTSSSETFTFTKFTTDQENCPISKMFLVSQTSSSAPDQSSLVYLSALTCTTSDLCTVNLDNLGGTHEFFIYMEANGGAFKYSTTKFTIIVPEAKEAFYDKLIAINSPPYFKGEVQIDHKVDAIINSEGELEDSSEYVYLTPIVEDPEND
jgi:hypothetical protein